MDEHLIHAFRDRVNENYFVLHRYKDCKGKNKWNCICSAMDWISVSVHYLCSSKVLNISKDENLNSVEVYTFLSCIDMMWEAIQQLHRVFMETDSIPFIGEKIIFSDNKFSMSDNEYFKTIRVCFGAHPVNLLDHFNGKEKERRFASWSGAFGSTGNFSVILYPSDSKAEDIFLDIRFKELWAFAERRYNYLNTLMDIIREKEKQYVSLQSKISINKVDNPLNQIKILIQQVQNMTFKELKWEERLSGKLPFSYHYAFESICDIVYGGYYKRTIGLNSLLEYVSDVVGIQSWESYDELYTLIEAAKYFKSKGDHHNKS